MRNPRASRRLRLAAATGGAFLALAAFAETGRLHFAPSGSISPDFGISVAIDGATQSWAAAGYDQVAVIGMPGLYGAENEAIHVFAVSGGAWSELVRRTPPDAAPGTSFAYGFSVDVEADAGSTEPVVAVVGAPGEDGGVGAAYVLSADMPGGPWSETKLLASDGATLDTFGFAVAIDGGIIVVAANLDDDDGTNSGSVYVFEPTAPGAWTQTAKLRAPGGAPGDEFGGSLAIDGDTIVVGSPEDDDAGSASGSVHVFVRGVGASWTHQAKLTASDADSPDLFGASVAISGDRVVIGAPFDDDNGTASGAAYVFERNPAGAWNEKARLVGSDTNSVDVFGASVGVDGDLVAVRAPNSYDWATYVFRPDDDGTWVEHEDLLLLDWATPAHYDFRWWPTTTAVHGSTVLAGVPGDEVTGEAVAFCLATQAQPADLPIAVVGRPYRARLGAAGQGWSRGDGSLPPGLMLDAATGELSGVPLSTGSFGHEHFTVRSTSPCGATVSHQLLLTTAAMPDLIRGKHTKRAELPVDHPHAAPLCHAFDLVAGTQFDVTVKVPKKGAQISFQVVDSAGRDVDVSSRMKIAKKSVRLKQFAVPDTDRYMVIVTAGGLVDKAKFTVKASVPKTPKGALELGAGESRDVSFGVLPGARVTLTAKAARKSSALPDILSVTDEDGTELLVPGATIHKGKKLILALGNVSVGGRLTVRLATRDGTSGVVTWKAKVKGPGGYPFSIPDLPAGTAR